MTDFPPPQDPVAAERAARLAALAARQQARGHTASAARTDRTRTEPAAHTSPARSKRHHPAKGARALALGLSLASTGGLAAFFAVSNGRTGHQLQEAQVVSTPAPMAAATRTAASATPDTVTVVDGGVFSNRWGAVQVEATFAADGSLVDVSTLQTPSGDRRSVQINNYAAPRLNADALTSQSADVDTISGATYTSTDYRRSLQSAIDAAAAVGVAVATA